MKLQILNSFSLVKETDWRQIVDPGFPFMSFEFLWALESTDCLGLRTGWEPQILVCYDQDRLLGAVVAFLRTNSFGEYIFDFGWADAYAKYGQEYYPKLTSAVPFTPATGRKILLRSDLSAEISELVTEQLLRGTLDLSERLELSSTHALFIKPEERPAFEQAGFFIRDSFQYHWKNQGYRNFEDFLQCLRSKRRTEILRERRQVQAAEVEIRRLTGSQLTPAHGQIMYDLYLSTMEKKSGFDFLTSAFFENVFSTMKDQILFVIAEKNGRPIAGALNYYTPNAIYGRHWGCLAEYRALHFELCYYQGIEFAIENKIPLFEGGAQGDHKFNRGFLPSLTYSAHHIRSAVFDQAIRQAVQSERRGLGQMFDWAKLHSPYSQNR